MITANSILIPPKPNFRISFGQDANFFIHCYAKKTPNKFQRWMMRKLLCINIEDI